MLSTVVSEGYPPADDGVQHSQGHRCQQELVGLVCFGLQHNTTQSLQFSVPHIASTSQSSNNNNNRIQKRYLRFFTISSQRREMSPTHEVARVQSCANHVQHIERLSRASVMLRATWYEGTAQLLSLTELKSHLFELYFIG